MNTKAIAATSALAALMGFQVARASHQKQEIADLSRSLNEAGLYTELKGGDMYVWNSVRDTVPGAAYFTGRTDNTIGVITTEPFPSFSIHYLRKKESGKAEEVMGRNGIGIRKGD
jgi:hypothetical protein